jgi:hypothetical protein
MRKVIISAHAFACITLLLLFFPTDVFAQAPQRMSYQAVIRNSSNDLVSNKQVRILINILQGSLSGSSVYSEVHTPTTNANGLATLEIGGGTDKSGIFANINWANGTYFIKTETDPTGGTSYAITGTNQLLSVPYALHAETASNGLQNGTVNNQIMYWNGTAWATLNPGIKRQILTLCSGGLTWTTDGQCPPLVDSLDCAGAINYGTLTANIAATEDVYIEIPYKGGNGEKFRPAAIFSTGVTGLLAAEAEPYFLNEGDGVLKLNIAGTADTAGTASFAIIFGGKSCVITREVAASR